MPEIGSVSFDNLFAGNVMPVVSEKITVMSGQDLDLGTVLGKVLKALGTAEADSENTGSANIENVSMLQEAIIGVYTIECISAEISAGDNDAEFAVYAPSGLRLQDAKQNEEYDGGHIVFTIGETSEGTAVAEGDKFTIEIEEGSKKAKIVEADAVDGSHIPYGILSEAVDASGEDKAGVAYMTGEFNEDKLIVPDGEDVSDYKEDLRKLGIFLKPAI